MSSNRKCIKFHLYPESQDELVQMTALKAASYAAPTLDAQRASITDAVCAVLATYCKVCFELFFFLIQRSFLYDVFNFAIIHDHSNKKDFSRQRVLRQHQLGG